MRKILKSFVIVSLMLLAYVVVTAQQDTSKQATSAPTPPPSKAKILVPNTSWDYGYMPKGIRVSHVYQIQNVGEDTLKISSVKPSCGCTSAPLKKNILAPGELVDLEVSFDAKNFMGKVHKTVTVNSNDATNPALVFSRFKSTNSEKIMVVAPATAVAIST